MTKTFHPSIDWLTLATWKYLDYCQVLEWLQARPGINLKDSRWMQYEGLTDGDGLFCGWGIQSNNKEHYILKITGRNTAETLPHILSTDWCKKVYGTRVDLQRTILAPDWWKPRDIKDWIETNGGTAELRESPTGTTVYIGNRQYRQFARLYEKNYERLYLRFEIELKAEAAKMAWGFIHRGIEPLEIYSTHLKRFLLPEYILPDFLPQPTKDLDITIHRKSASEEAQYSWLSSLIPTFQKMANSHNIGQRVRDVFYSLSLEQGDSDNEQ
jgi:hypothetical protein